MNAQVQVTDPMRALFVQACINTGNGKWGKVDFAGYSDVKPFDVGGVQGYTATVERPELPGGKACFIVFQGSASKDDWKANFMIRLVKWVRGLPRKLVAPYGNNASNVRTHEGWTRMWLAAREEIRNRMKAALSVRVPIWYLGHSQGSIFAAYALLDAQYLLVTERGGTANMLAGYGAAMPKPGNGAFKKSFTRRVGHCFFSEWLLGDPVVQVPMWWLGYASVGVRRCWSTVLSIILAPIFFLPNLIGWPSWAWWQHYPQRLLAVIKRERVPTIKECKAAERSVQL